MPVAGEAVGGNQLVIVILAAGALLAVVGFIFGPLIRLALSRRRESLADVSGVELTRNPAGLLSALKKLQQNDKPFKKMNHATAAMCIDDPLQHHEAWYHRLYDTHPPIEERIADAREDRLGPVGLTGTVGASRRVSSRLAAVRRAAAAGGSASGPDAAVAECRAGSPWNRGNHLGNRAVCPRRPRRTPPP